MNAIHHTDPGSATRAVASENDIEKILPWTRQYGPGAFYINGDAPLAFLLDSMDSEIRGVATELLKLGFTRDVLIEDGATMARNDVNRRYMRIAVNDDDSRAVLMHKSWPIVQEADA
jgi:hypothetical protein